MVLKKDPVGKITEVIKKTSHIKIKLKEDKYLNVGSVVL